MSYHRPPVQLALCLAALPEVYVPGYVGGGKLPSVHRWNVMPLNALLELEGVYFAVRRCLPGLSLSRGKPGIIIVFVGVTGEFAVDQGLGGRARRCNLL